MVFTNEQDGSTQDLAQGESKVAPGFYRVAARCASDQRIDAILLTDGNHTRQVSNEGFQVKLTRGDRLTLKIRTLARVPSGVPSPEAKTPSENTDCKVAEWVLSIGGAIKINEKQTEIKAAVDLPKEAFALSLVYLGNNDKVNDADLARFKNCDNLTWLDLSGTKVSAAGLSHLKDSRKLTAIVLDRTQLGDSAVASLKDIKNLTQLYLVKTKFTSAGIEELKQALPLCKVKWNNAVSKTLPPTFKNSIGMEFVIVPKGKSWLGGSKDKLGDQPVTSSRDFYLGKYLVTQEEWQRVMGSNPSHFSRNGEGKDAVKYLLDADLKRFPVEQVSWNDAREFLAKLNESEKNEGWMYRLPIDWEWEYACRGGPMTDKAESAFDFYFEKPTNQLLAEQANFEHGKGLKRPSPVGSYPPNRLGLFDMHGNVWEWSDEAEDHGRVVRGGCCFRDAGECRAAYRYGIVPERRLNDVGLHVVRVPSGAPSP